MCWLHNVLVVTYYFHSARSNQIVLETSCAGYLFIHLHFDRTACTPEVRCVPRYVPVELTSSPLLPEIQADLQQAYAFKTSPECHRRKANRNRSSVFLLNVTEFKRYSLTFKMQVSQKFDYCAHNVFISQWSSKIS